MKLFSFPDVACSVRSWGSHTAPCVHAYCLVLLLGKDRSCLLPRATDGMLMWHETKHCTCTLDPAYQSSIWLLFSNSFMSTLFWRVVSDPELRSWVWRMFPLACSCKLHSSIQKGGNLTEFSQIEKTVFQALWKHLGNSLQPSFLVSSLFIYFFNIKRIMVLILRISFVVLSLNIARWAYMLLSSEAYGSQVLLFSISLKWLQCICACSFDFDTVLLFLFCF